MKGVSARASRGFDRASGGSNKGLDEGRLRVF